MKANKKLSEMSSEKLWHLFPIFLSGHNDNWAAQYHREEKRIQSFLLVNGVKISHIGSTSIKAIWAKPIVDILLEIPQSISMEKVRDTLLCNGYLCMGDEKIRKDFNKGYTETGFADKVFHLHLRYWNDNDELYFRDYLNEKPVIAKQYEELKLMLWKRYEYNRDAYTDAKGDFVKEQTQAAKLIYGERYNRL